MADNLESDGLHTSCIPTARSQLLDSEMPPLHCSAHNAAAKFTLAAHAHALAYTLSLLPAGRPLMSSPSWSSRRPEARLLVNSQVRKSPYWALTQEAGCHRYSVLSNTYHPRGYFSAADGGLLGEHEHARRGVALWDETPDRQIAIRGRDALAFADYLATRDVWSRLSIGRACYTLVCDQTGGIIGDPVILRVGEDELWLSGNLELLYFVKGVRAHSGCDVSVSALDIAPIHLHGPTSSELLAYWVDKALIQRKVLDLDRFQLCHTYFDDVPITIMRMELLGAATYEFYPWDSSINGPNLWRKLLNEGAQFGLRVTAPPNIRRVEAGIRFYHSEMSLDTNPFEVGLDWLVQFSRCDFLGRDALEHIHHQGVSRKLTGIEFGGPAVTSFNEGPWPVCVAETSSAAGMVTFACWSPDRNSNIGYAFLPVAHAYAGNTITIRPSDSTSREATVTSIPFLDTPA